MRGREKEKSERARARENGSGTDKKLETVYSSKARTNYSQRLSKSWSKFKA